MKIDNIKVLPSAVFDEYKIGVEYKNGIGKRGINEQSKVNERFYVGDHWYGANCGKERPLVRRNLIKRIGEQKLSTISAAPVAVNYTVEGVPNNKSITDERQNVEEAILNGGDFQGDTEPSEISFISDVLSDYFRITSERVKFDIQKEQLLLNAYISGTGIAYTYWDSEAETGLFADQSRTAPIKGDINFEVLNVENVVFGDPNIDDVQNQPYIIIAQRVDCASARREAHRNGISKEEIEQIKPDGSDYYGLNAGTIGESEPTNSKKITVLTKFWKTWDKNGLKYDVMCERVTEKAHIRKPWSIGTKLYPIAKMCWIPRFSSAYGESEITHLIPNQIALNRALSSEVWSVMTTGMPITVVNGDIVSQPLTNTPGQILKVYGGAEDVGKAIHHIQPPAFSTQLINAIDNLASNTLSDSGANDAALGNMRPDNAAAIIQLREAALQPMQLVQNRFYACIEDIAKIWADFWLHNYGDRQLKYENKDGTYYVPFHASRYENLLFNVRIDVGSSPLWDISSTVAMLDNLLHNQLINKLQYLERMPAGIIPDINGLIEDSKKELQAMPMSGEPDTMTLLQEQYPELYQKLQSLPPEQQQAVLAKIQSNMSGQAVGDL